MFYTKQLVLATFERAKKDNRWPKPCGSLPPQCIYYARFPYYDFTMIKIKSEGNMRLNK